MSTTNNLDCEVDVSVVQIVSNLLYGLSPCCVAFQWFVGCIGCDSDVLLVTFRVGMQAIFDRWRIPGCNSVSVKNFLDLQLVGAPIWKFVVDVVNGYRVHRQYWKHGGTNAALNSTVDNAGHVRRDGDFPSFESLLVNVLRGVFLFFFLNVLLSKE